MAGCIKRLRIGTQTQCNTRAPTNQDQRQETLTSRAAAPRPRKTTAPADQNPSRSLKVETNHKRKWIWKSAVSLKKRARARGRPCPVGSCVGRRAWEATRRPSFSRPACARSARAAIQPRARRSVSAQGLNSAQEANSYEVRPSRAQASPLAQAPRPIQAVSKWLADLGSAGYRLLDQVGVLELARWRLAPRPARLHSVDLLKTARYSEIP